ncbi:ribonuclease H-like domain-containing protein [Mycena sp. CBHHK59/15]|nr:ribonuclease H-like domain-containing protein [Mycena sp. CBHHK59/15]
MVSKLLLFENKIPELTVTPRSECEAQVKGFQGAKYKKFLSCADAEAWIAGVESPAKSTATTSSSKTAAHSGSDNSKGKKRMMTPDVEDESGWDVVYSDGACKGNGKVGSIAGVGVWWGRDDRRNIAERCPGDQTNNRAELIAILRILETTPKSKRPLLIKSDSQYSIHCFKDWLPGWLRNNFISASGQPVKNAALIRYLSAHLDARAGSGQKVRLQYVKAHNGEEGNEGADAQANVGAYQPPAEERDWTRLEAELRARLDAELRDTPDRPEPVLLEVGNHEDGFAVRGYVGSPTKIRRKASPVVNKPKSAMQQPKPLSRPVAAQVSKCKQATPVVQPSTLVPEFSSSVSKNCHCPVFSPPADCRI